MERSAAGSPSEKVPPHPEWKKVFGLGPYRPSFTAKPAAHRAWTFFLIHSLNPPADRGNGSGQERPCPVGRGLCRERGSVRTQSEHLLPFRMGRNLLARRSGCRPFHLLPAEPHGRTCRARSAPPRTRHRRLQLLTRLSRRKSGRHEGGRGQVIVVDEIGIQCGR